MVIFRSIKCDSFVEKKNVNEIENLQIETVLVLQGGGSLGAYECGVYKTLYNHGIEFNILAGSSIGAINAAIICSVQNQNQNHKSLSNLGRILVRTFREY